MATIQVTRGDSLSVDFEFRHRAPREGLVEPEYLVGCTATVELRGAYSSVFSGSTEDGVVVLEPAERRAAVTITDEAMALVDPGRYELRLRLVRPSGGTRTVRKVKVRVDD